MFYEMTAVLNQQMFEYELAANWSGEPMVVAFLFAHPDSRVIRSLDQRGAYFDIRSGDSWDLFFPGYYEARASGQAELQTGAVPVGRRFAAKWFFSPHDFDYLRQHVEQSSGGRWRFSGEADLVLANGWFGADGDPTIDWTSTKCGELSDPSRGIQTLSLAEAVERISRDIESHAEDSHYGVRRLTESGEQGPDNSFERDLMSNALGGIAAALAGKALGL